MNIKKKYPMMSLFLEQLLKHLRIFIQDINLDLWLDYLVKTQYLYRNKY